MPWQELKDMEADGLVKLEPGIIKVTEIGRTFLRNIAIRSTPTSSSRRRKNHATPRPC